MFPSLASQARLSSAATEDLLAFLARVGRHCRDLFESYRWQVGSKIIDVALVLRWKQRPPTAQDHLEELFNEVSMWKAHHHSVRFSQTAYPVRRRTRPINIPKNSTYAILVNEVSGDVNSDLKEKLVVSDTTIRELIEDNPIDDAPLVSVIMPTYNRASIIEDAIRSIIDQTYSNWELQLARSHPETWKYP